MKADNQAVGFLTRFAAAEDRLAFVVGLDSKVTASKRLKAESGPAGVPQALRDSLSLKWDKHAVVRRNADGTIGLDRWGSAGANALETVRSVLGTAMWSGTGLLFAVAMVAAHPGSFGETAAGFGAIICGIGAADKAISSTKNALDSVVWSGRALLETNG